MKLIDRVLLGHTLPFFGAVFLSLVARGQAITGPLYSADAYSYLWFGQIDYSLFLSQGRFGQALLVWLRESLGYNGIEVAASGLILAVLLFAHSGLLLAHVVLRKPTTAEVTVFLVLATIHPFTTEFFYFAEATLSIAISLWVASAALYACSVVRKPLLAMVMAVLILALALAMYQTAIAIALAVALLALVARLTALDSPVGEPLLRSRQVRVTAATLASVPAYLLAARIVAWVTGVPLDARTRLSGLLGDAPAKLVTMVDAVSLSLWPTPGLISRFDSAVLLALLLVSSAGLVWSLLRGRRWTAAILCLGLLGIGLLWSAGASALGDVVWLVPRTMVGICVFAAGLVMLGWRVRQGRVWHTVLGAGLVVLTIGYVGASNQILFDQWVLNRWDTQQATRILARLEVEPGYEDLHALAIIGGLPGYPSALQTMGGDMNASALAISWGKLGLIEQATGYRFASPTETELADAKAQCEGIDPWPAPGSILVRQGLGIVCLPQ